MFVAKRSKRPLTPRGMGRSREVSLIVLICAGLCLVFLLAFGESGFIELRKKERDVRQLELERDRQMQINSELEKDIERLKNDPSRIEKLAREELKLTGKGEIVIQLQDPAEESPRPPSTRP